MNPSPEQIRRLQTYLDAVYSWKIGTEEARQIVAELLYLASVVLNRHG